MISGPMPSPYAIAILVATVLPVSLVDLSWVFGWFIEIILFEYVVGFDDDYGDRNIIFNTKLQSAAKLYFIPSCWASTIRKISSY